MSQPALRLRRPDREVGQERWRAERAGRLPTVRRPVLAGPDLPCRPEHLPVQQGPRLPVGH
eukprot:15455583-Alexandrium_andersonii.AAC.1